MNKALKFALPILAIIVGITVSILLFLSRPAAEHKALNIKAPLVTVTRVEAESKSIPVYTRGTVTPGTEIQLMSEVSGQVLELSPNFANGGFFRKGDVLIKIDPIEYEVNIKRAQAGKAQAYQAMLQAEAEKKARSRVKGSSTNALANYEIQYQQAKAHYEAAVAELDAVKMQRDRTTIRAPFDGRVRLAVLNVGQYVRPGLQMGIIYAVDVAEVRLPLSDRQLGLVQVPQGFRMDSANQPFPEVTLTEQFAGRTYTWQGKVVRAEGGVDERNRLLYVIARVESPYDPDPNQPGRPELVAGSFVEASIAGRKFDRIYEVPRKALRNSSQLWIVDGDDKLREREVAIIYKGKDFIYVSSGLEDGDRVVLSQMDIAVDGMTVRTKQTEDYEFEAEPQTEDNNLFGAAGHGSQDLTAASKLRVEHEQKEPQVARQSAAVSENIASDTAAADSDSVAQVTQAATQPEQTANQLNKPVSQPATKPAEAKKSAPEMSFLAAEIAAEMAAQEKPLAQDEPAADKADAVSLDTTQPATAAASSSKPAADVKGKPDAASNDRTAAGNVDAASSVAISTVTAPEPLVEAVQ